MLDERQRKRMKSLDSIYNVVQQSRMGISAVDIAKKLGKNSNYRTTVHRHLTSLELTCRVRNEHGLWYPIVGPISELKRDPTTEFFKFLVENANSPILKETLWDLEAAEMTKFMLEEVLPKKNELTDPLFVQKIVDRLSETKIHAIKKLMKELGYE